MAKKRRGRVAPTPTKAQTAATKSAKTRKRSTVRRPVVSTPDPESDVFIASCSGVAVYIPLGDRGVSQRELANAQVSDDVDVFLPSPGRPVAVQSDWVDDTGATVRHGDPSVWEPFQGIRPRAGSPVHWSRAELYAHGLELRKERNGPRVRCRFGCDGTTSNVAGVSHHSYACSYWTREEGHSKTPF